MSGKGRLFCSCWPVSPHTSLNTTGIVNAFGYLLERDVKAVVKDTAFLGHRMWRNHVGSHLEASCLLDAFQSAGR